VSQDDAYRRHLERVQGSESTRDQLDGLQVWFDGVLPAQPAAGDLALDYGAGRGQALEYLRGRGFQAVEAYEPHPVLSADLRARGETVHDDPDPRAFLRAHPGRFSLVLCKDVLEHVPTTETVDLVRDLAGTLRPGGLLVASVPHAVSFVGTYLRYADFTHHTAFTESSLRYVLEEAGLTQVRFGLPRFKRKLHPKTLTYRALKRGWHAVLKAIYYLEHPSPEHLPRHFHPRLVATGVRS
jgi:2-polyprenyl-3-methyl-5-hydroxy-6-metoxy-1,4-benzoquinol methylase